MPVLTAALRHIDYSVQLVCLKYTTLIHTNLPTVSDRLMIIYSQYHMQSGAKTIKIEIG